MRFKTENSKLKTEDSQLRLAVQVRLACKLSRLVIGEAPDSAEILCAD
jgi:hypothetical protein